MCDLVPTHQGPFACFALFDALLLYLLDPVQHCDQLAVEDEPVTLLYIVFVGCSLSWFHILRGDLFYVLPCVILFLCFSVLLALRLPRLGSRPRWLSWMRRPTGDQEVAGSIVEIDHEIFSTVILSLPLIQEGQLSVSGERMCTILVNRLED